MESVGTGMSADGLAPGRCWRLIADINGHARSSGPGLATQARRGRGLQLLDQRQGSRLRVRLLEDGYPCWLEISDLLERAIPAPPSRPLPVGASRIHTLLPQVLAFGERARQQPNHYLWGGSLGPDYDCSGLVQSAFASAGIWIPRDAYQQERFCQPVAVRPGIFALLRPGDLIFFGRPQRCSHVGLYLGGGRYLHSSGREHGRDGLGIDQLSPEADHPVSCHYRGELRGAGRVQRCHDGTTLA
ncbi:MAG: C40 family peptidase [Cyanobacteria bacterium]|nr:C40 family peptidase [Cyanobacteriota bacterium]